MGDLPAEPTQHLDFVSEDFLSYRNEEPYSGHMTMKTEVMPENKESQIFKEVD